MASTWGLSFGAAWGVSWGDPGVTPPEPPVVEEEVHRGGGGRGIFGLGERKKVRGRTAREDLDRIFARLERVEEQEVAPPPAAETVEAVTDAIEALPDLSAALPVLARIEALLEQLGQENAARQIALAAKRKAEEDEEEAVVTALLLN
jgi:hypothetical protein